MNYKDHATKLILRVVNILKPLAISLALLLVLNETGLLSSVSYMSQRALLMTGLKDPASEKVTLDEDFDYQFTIKDLKGNRIRFDEFKGKVVFLNLWATWCGPCRAEMPGIQSLYEKLDKEKVTFVMLSIDRDSDQGKVRDYLLKKSFTFPTYMPSQYLPGQLNVPAIPTTFIISKEGKIVRKEIGSMRYNTSKFQKYLETLSQE